MPSLKLPAENLNVVVEVGLDSGYEIEVRGNSDVITLKPGLDGSGELDVTTNDLDRLLFAIDKVKAENS